VRTEPRGRKERPITNVTNTALRKEELAVHRRIIQDEQPEDWSSVARMNIPR
jgi:hypothetical protein